VGGRTVLAAGSAFRRDRRRGDARPHVEARPGRNVQPTRRRANRAEVISRRRLTSNLGRAMGG